MPVYREAVDAALWFKRIELIANGGLGSVENALRHASHLLQLTPQELRPLVGLAIDPEAFEELLELGHLDTAAQCLVGQPEALSIEGGPQADLIRATIQCAALNEKVHGIDKTAAQAILNAWTGCLLRLKARYGEDLSGLSRHGSHGEHQSSASATGERNGERTGAGDDTSAQTRPERA